MLLIEKKMFYICFIAVLLSVASIVEPYKLSLIMMVLSGYLYFAYLFNVIKLIYNRKRIVEESKCPSVVLVFVVYVANIVNLSLIVWVTQQLQSSSFPNVNSYFDALYYTLITFSTVGYGEIIPATIFAKTISIIIILSNFLLLLAFVNLFVMQAKKKKDYLDLIMYQICFTFIEMSSCCGTVDKSNKEKKKCWSEWVDIFIDLLSSVEENNPERIKDIEDKRKDIREYNCQCAENTEYKEMPYYYINGEDKLLIEEFISSCRKVIDTIEFLEANKIFLLENGNLSQEQFLVLSEIKDGFKVAEIHYRYGIKEGNDMMRAFKKDLYRDLEQLGYRRFNLAEFQGYDIHNNHDLAYSLARIDVTDQKEVFWINVKGIVDRVLKL